MYNVCVIVGFNHNIWDYELETIECDVLNIETAKLDAREYAKNDPERRYVVTDSYYNFV